MGGTASICEPINECEELGGGACHGGGRCIDADDGYRCECGPGRGGPTCAERRQQTRLADVNIRAGAVAIIAVCILLLLRQYRYVYSPANTAKYIVPLTKIALNAGIAYRASPSRMCLKRRRALSSEREE